MAVLKDGSPLAGAAVVFNNYHVLHKGQLVRDLGGD